MTVSFPASKQPKERPLTRAQQDALREKECRDLLERYSGQHFEVRNLWFPDCVVRVACAYSRSADFQIVRFLKPNTDPEYRVGHVVHVCFAMEQLYLAPAMREE